MRCNTLDQLSIHLECSGKWTFLPCVLASTQHECKQMDGYLLDVASFFWKHVHLKLAFGALAIQLIHKKDKTFSDSMCLPWPNHCIYLASMSK
jgi:hypothetical protein